MRSFLLLLFLLPAALYAQKGGNYKFGDISAKDFNLDFAAIDSSADAIILSDIGTTKIEGNGKGWFSLVFKHYRKAIIRNKNAFELASASIPLYKSEEGTVTLEKLRASAYNLVSGKVVETKLDPKDDVFEEKNTKHNFRKKFTLANVREGTIIEYEITTKSDFIVYPEPWEFQGKYPRLYSEYRITVPNFLYYVMHTQGYFNYDEEKRTDGYETFTIRYVNDANQTQTASINAGVATYIWVLKNAPAIRDENYTASASNHIQKIGFQLSETREPLNFQQVIESWPQVTNKMLTSNDFGLILKVDRSWMNDILYPLKQNSSNKLELAKKIFYYLSSTLTCTDKSSIGLDKPLREVLKSKSGSVAEINSLLVSMLSHAEIPSDPVILSTRDNGMILVEEPILSNFNYLVCRTRIDGKTYYLDASEPSLGFGYLPLQCYNGMARVINETADKVYFYANSIKEARKTRVDLKNTPAGMTGTYSRVEAYYSSVEMRRRLAEKGKEEWLKELQKTAGEIQLSDLRIDSLDKLESPLKYTMTLSIPTENNDLIYFEPLLLEGLKQNPFNSTTRYYPVEMPYGVDYDYTLSLVIPDGYVLEEKPKDLDLVFRNKEDGLFEYKTAVSGNSITLHYRLFLRRANYEPNEYTSLRNFFTEVVKKQNEQLVFRKKK